MYIQMQKINEDTQKVWYKFEGKVLSENQLMNMGKKFLPMNGNTKYSTLTN